MLLTTRTLDDLQHASTFVPVQNLVKCGSAHTFPMSVLDPDEKDMAVCLATPDTPKNEEEEERNEIETLWRRVVGFNEMANRRKRLLKKIGQGKTKAL